MKVLAWGTFDLGKPRCRILLQGLAEHGIDVTRCHRDVWSDVADKSELRGFGPRLRRALRWLAAYPPLVLAFLRQPRPDVVFVGYLGLLDVLVLWPFARARRLPVVWDAFLSLHETVVVDRGLLGRRHPLARLLFALEWLAARCANRILLDTAAQADFFRGAVGIAAGRVDHVWVGAEPAFFAAPREPAAPEAAGRPLRVLFYGQLIPLHGIATIVEAARALRDEPISWTLIGRGQESGLLQELLGDGSLPAVQWQPWLPYEELPNALAAHDLCLGVFGTSDKAGRVIPNKVFQIVAAGKPLVTRDGPAIRELLTPGPGVELVPPGDPAALAAAVRRFRARPPSAARGPFHAELRPRIAPGAIGGRLAEILASVRDSARPAALAAAD